MSIGNLGDIPDLGSFESESKPAFEPFVDGWYKGQILAKREFTDKNGNDRVFESTDTPSAKGDSRNIRLQLLITRKDGKTMNLSALVNYNPEDLTQDVVQKVRAQSELVKAGEQWGTLFKPYMTLTRLSALQNIAGVRQLQRNPEGGLDLNPLYGKTAYFRIKPDSRNPLYKEVDKFQVAEPKRVSVL